MYPIINNIPLTSGKLSLKIRAPIYTKKLAAIEEILVEMQLIGKGQHDTRSLSLKYL